MMNKKISIEKFNFLIDTLSDKYKIKAPTAFENEGRYSYDDDVRYSEIKKFEDIVFNKKSSGSPKEILLPIVHTIAIQVENSTIETVKYEDDRDILIFLHPCDIHGITRTDDTFKNDAFYQNRRKKIKFVMMECTKDGWDSCFCTALNTNKTDNYSLALKVEGDMVYLSSKDEALNEHLKDLENLENFNFNFVEENKIEVN
ncbi:MAG: anaerobic sulfite reductase subunit AsrA, partial [Fusobacteriaceae bacterium]